MRRPARQVLSVLLALLMAAACSSDKPGNKKATAKPASSGLPAVSGSYGTKPAIAKPAGKAPSSTVKKVLSEGNGPAVAKGSLLVADYLGQIWQGKVFDNSYERGTPAAFPIGVGKVIPAWDESLVGVKAGSRVELIVPPGKGYGAQGNSDAGIKGTDTLIFVVDVIQAIAKNAAGDTKATVQKVAGPLPAVTGALGRRPKVTVPKSLKQPTKVVTVVLARGTGPAIKRGLVVLQFEAVTWSGKTAGSTWQSAQPEGVTVGDPQQQGVFNGLIGVPVGSRVLLEIPARPAQGQTPATEALVAVLDVVSAPPAAKDAPR